MKAGRREKYAEGPEDRRFLVTVGTEAPGRRRHLQYAPWKAIRNRHTSYLQLSSWRTVGWAGGRLELLMSQACFPDPHPQLATSSFLLFLLTGIVSVAFLLLPLQDELGSQLPQILHVSLGQKLVAAYILGEHSSG